MLAQNIGIQEFFLRKSEESFDSGIMKELRSFSTGAKSTLQQNVFSTIVFRHSIAYFSIVIFVFCREFSITAILVLSLVPPVKLFLKET